MDTPATPEPTGFQPTHAINIRRTETSIDFFRVWQDGSGATEDRPMDGEELAATRHAFLAKQLSRLIDPRLLPQLAEAPEPVSFSARTNGFEVEVAICVRLIPADDQAQPVQVDDFAIIPTTVEDARRMGIVLPGNNTEGRS